MHIPIGEVRPADLLASNLSLMNCSRRHSMNNVMTELTKNAYTTITRMLNDRDRRAFAIYFAMEVRADSGRLIVSLSYEIL